jgi:uncharacterized membrane protein YbaN (DUF454 family)
MQRVFPLLVSFCYKESQPRLQNMWWKEPKVRTHFYIVKGDVWRTTLGILDKKHLQAYIMTLLILQIFKQLFPFME